MRKITIAIDGYSSCGKSTIAKGVARALNYLFIDSGAMYRAVTLYCLRHEIIKEGRFDIKDVVSAMEKINLEFKKNPAVQLFEIYLNGVNVEKEIREMDVANFVSPISAVRGVRTKVIRLQKELGKGKGIVMDGRDIGTNVFPDAELKIFMTADEAVRAQRRWAELSEKGVKITLEQIRENLRARDYEDTHREHNPLRKANDAVVLDNTALSLDEQLDFVLKLSKEKIFS